VGPSGYSQCCNCGNDPKRGYPMWLKSWLDCHRPPDEGAPDAAADALADAPADSAADAATDVATP
jgi:hypothetical protein